MTGKAAEETDRYCRYCEQRVPPVVHNKVGRSFGGLAVLEVAAVVVAFVALFQPLPLDVGIASITVLLVMWPAAIEPAWLGLLAAVAAVVLSAIVSVRASERARREATCPTCLLRLETE
jgi:hypothetical protein